MSESAAELGTLREASKQAGSDVGGSALPKPPGTRVSAVRGEH
jgi:hypothetical protein